MTRSTAEGPCAVNTVGDLGPLFASVEEPLPHGEVIVILRAAMVALWQRRAGVGDPSTAYVTADDIANWHDASGRSGIDGRRMYGSVLRPPEWKFVGWTRSTRATNKGSDLRKWAYVGPSSTGV